MSTKIVTCIKSLEINWNSISVPSQSKKHFDNNISKSVIPYIEVAALETKKDNVALSYIPLSTVHPEARTRLHRKQRENELRGHEQRSLVDSYTPPPPPLVDLLACYTCYFTTLLQ